MSSFGFLENRNEGYVSLTVVLCPPLDKPPPFHQRLLAIPVIIIIMVIIKHYRKHLLDDRHPLGCSHL